MLIAFSDDLAILTYGKTLSEVEAYGNSELTTIKIWAGDNKKKFNESKSKAMIITKKEDEIRSTYSSTIEAWNR